VTVRTDTIPIDVRPVQIAQREATPLSAQREVVFDIQDLAVKYGSAAAISRVELDVYRNLITAVIGPSGCGKSTFIRCLNRLNDLVPGAKIGSTPFGVMTILAGSVS